MLNNPYADRDSNDILERLKHPEQEESRRKMDRNLYVRNILNTLFILMAIVAMVGIVLTDKGGNLMAWYGLGLFAVVVKMVEVVLRMPGVKRNR